MEQILTAIIALIFLGIGYVLGSHHQDKEVIKKTIRQIKKLNPSVKPGVINYPTQEDIDYVESGEDKVDAERERVFKEQFTPHA